MKHKLRKHALPIGLVTGLLLAIAVGWFGVIGPQRATSAKLKVEIEQTRAEIVSRRARAAHDSTNEPVEVADVYRLGKAMPKEVDMAGILLELNGLAGKSGISFESISPHAPTTGAGGTKAVAIDLSLVGTYYDLSDFLYRLRNLVEVRSGELVATGRLFTIESLTFAEGKGGLPQIQAALSLTTYLYGPPVDAAAGNDPAAAAAATSTTPATTTPAVSAAGATP
ncbi:MAG: type 4a pilus biogenesis protein PilO [Gaiellaceae bacterium]